MEKSDRIAHKSIDGNFITNDWCFLVFLWELEDVTIR